MSDRSGSRIGILADIHGNLQALEAVLAHMDEAGVERLYCLGDVAGYGGDPAACIAIVRERCAATVRGNHDQAVVDPSLRSWFNEHARQAIERQAELLGEDDREWLAGLPPVIRIGDLTLGHSGFADPERYDYVVDDRQAAIELDALDTRWGFVGHTHVPAVWHRSPEGRVEAVPLGPDRAADPGAIVRRGAWTPAEASVRLDRPGRYLVNPGAVGQPRDRDPRTASAVLDPAAGELLHARLPYDVTGAQDAIRRRGLPLVEAGRLAYGW